MPGQDPDKNNSIKVIFIKIIIKINIFKIYIKNTHSIALKYNIIRNFIFIRNRFSSACKAIKKVFIILLVTNQSGIGFYCCQRQVHHAFFELYFYQDRIQLKQGSSETVLSHLYCILY